MRPVIQADADDLVRIRNNREKLDVVERNGVVGTDSFDCPQRGRVADDRLDIPAISLKRDTGVGDATVDDDADTLEAAHAVSYQAHFRLISGNGYF